VLRLILILFAFTVGSALAADPDPRSRKGVFGQLQPHGEPIEKAFIGLYAGRTNLHFGQPMRVDLFAIAATKDGPYVHPHLTQTANAKLELTDTAGKPVPFRMAGGAYSGGGGVESASFTLWPTPPHAAGVYWKPGQYTLRATVTNPDEPTNPITIPGTFKSNELAFTVGEPGAALDRWDGKGELRRVDQQTQYGTDDVFLYVAGLDEASSERLREQCGWEKTAWQVAVAGFAPVAVRQDRKLTDAEAKKLIDDLKSDDPDARIRAVRSVQPTAAVEVFSAAVELLADDYQERRAFNKAIWVKPIRVAAADALGRLEAAGVEPLIAFAERPENQSLRPTVARILGKIGPHFAAEKYLRTAIRSGHDDLIYATQEAAMEWGKGGLGVSRAIVTDPKVRKEICRVAVEAIGQHGDLKTDGPTLRKLLASPDLSGLQQEAVAALARLRDTDSLPEFERIARDPKIDQNTRYPAVDAVLTLADAKTGDRLLMDLIARPIDRLRGLALIRAGQRKLADARPPALDALDDKDWYTRVMADYALRGLAGDRAGVGYNPGKPDSKLWRDYWAKKK
jgi:HEAT repeat protein